MVSLLPLAPANLELQSLPAAHVEALYVHVPFCFHKCHYCDFYSITRQGPERMAAFVERVLSEARMWSESIPPEQLRPTTVFFGGGTPSLLPQQLMQCLLSELRNILDLSAVNEWTIECNPATVTLEYLQMLRSAGVDRLSFGAQSFDRNHLHTLERHHDPDDVPRSVGLAREAGFQRVNIDLIYAIPGQTLEQWAETLETAIALKTEHISAYGLTYEPNTPIAVKKRLGQLQPAEESVELQMLQLARRLFSDAGLAPYEISNYARPGEACRHNLVYWTGGSYAALGPSGSSHIAGHRWRNCPHLGEWEQAVDQKKLPAIDVESLTPAARAGELAMLMLRLTGGIDVDLFIRRLGQDPLTLFSETIATLRNNGLLASTHSSIHITDRGIPVSDAIAAEFIAAVP